MEYILQYGLFLAEIATVVVAIIAIVSFFVVIGSKKQHRKGTLKVTDLAESYHDKQRVMQQAKMDEAELKVWHKAFKKQQKKEQKLSKNNAKEGRKGVVKPCLYVIDFKGSMDAHEVGALREEISAILSVAQAGDEVLLCLESPGGMVHGYGLAAAQLTRLKDKGIKLTAVVDKVAASGGYMMACVADKIVAAPFAIIGSIGVVAQIPNIHRLLKKNDIDVELHTAGEYKRTLTLLGENTDEGREKFKQDLNETHLLFKSFVHKYRPELDIDSVATGEYWYGTDAVDKGLIDEVGVSDDWLISRINDFEVLSVQYILKKKMVERVTGGAMESVDKLMMRWLQRGKNPLL
ncbi:protease SohB [Proteus mirabilis]|uniref:protease SohB n=1 Tax=Proteus mirabilis TaxID=584 RepID=UPI000538A5C7|nr:protease SohB [Proteus mirabilis]AUT91646.1 protease SohB [Proteus mirabilis]MBG2891672.1 protease SohB [Proteus mirabilis]MBG2951685.1 protease SohB [Proteus mirabilis]MBG2975501.1 protease SohB [Proteus mirabilis]MBG3025318.1 protease SohB [Proteus mirabilis]